MQGTYFVLVISALMAVALGQGQPEDPEPITTVTECGGMINSSSALVTFTSLEANQHCVWTVKAPYGTLRFNLASSDLGANGGIYLTRFIGNMPGFQYDANETNTNYTFSAGVVLVTLSVGPMAPTGGFSLQFFSSGNMDDGTLPFTGYESHNEASGNRRYPTSGSYVNDENALFIVAPSTPGQRTLRFTGVDVEGGSGCPYDAVTVYNWFNNMYTQLAVFCGQTAPPAYTLESGVGLITFRTDSSVVGTGFTYEWL